MQRQGQAPGQDSAPAQPVQLQLQSAPPVDPTVAQLSMPPAAARMADAPNPFRAVVTAEQPPAAKPMFSGLNAVVNPFRPPSSSPPRPQPHTATASPGASPPASHAPSSSVALALVNAEPSRAAPITSRQPASAFASSAAVVGGPFVSVSPVQNPFAAIAAPALVAAGRCTAAPVSRSQQGSASAATGSSIPGNSTPTSTPATTPVSITAAVPPVGQRDAAAPTSMAAPAHSISTMSASMAPTAPATVQEDSRTSDSFQAEICATTSAAAALPSLASAAVPSAAATTLQMVPTAAVPLGLRTFNPSSPSAPSAPSVPSAPVLPLGSVAASVPATAANLPTTSVTANVPAAAANLPPASRAAAVPAADLPPSSTAAALPAAPASLLQASTADAMPASIRPASKRKWDVMAQSQPDGVAATSAAAATTSHAVASGTAAGGIPPPPVSLLPSGCTAQAGHNTLVTGTQPPVSSSAAGPAQLPILGPPLNGLAAVGVSQTGLASAAPLPASQPLSAAEAAPAAASKALVGKDLAAKLAADFAQQHKSKQLAVTTAAGSSGKQAAPVEVSIAIKAAAAAAAEKVLQERAVRAKAAAEKHIHDQALKAKHSVQSGGDVHAARMEALRLRNAARHGSPQAPAAADQAATTAVVPEPQLAAHPARHPAKSQHAEATSDDSRPKKKRGRDEDQTAFMEHDTETVLPGPPADHADLSSRRRERASSPASAGSRDSLRRQETRHSSDSRQVW